MMQHKPDTCLRRSSLLPGKGMNNSGNSFYFFLRMIQIFFGVFIHEQSLRQPAAA